MSVNPSPAPSSRPAPIVFLDIDGVLNTRRAAGWPRWRPVVPKGVPRPFAHVMAARARMGWPSRVLDRDAIARLDALCREIGALIVVSSTWRLERDVRGILAGLGFTGGFHDDWRTDADGPSRGHEIARWLAAHGAPDFVAFDDKPQLLPEQRSRLVLTDHYAGLSQADCDRARRLLIGGE